MKRKIIAVAFSSLFILLLSHFLTTLTFAASGLGQRCTSGGPTDQCQAKYPGQDLSCQDITCTGKFSSCTGKCLPATGVGCATNGKPDNSKCKNGMLCFKTPADQQGQPPYTCQQPGGNDCTTNGKPDNAKCQNGTTCQLTVSGNGTGKYSCQKPKGAQGASCDPSKTNQCNTGLTCTSINGDTSGNVGECEPLPTTAATLPPPPSPPCVAWSNGQCQTFNTTFGAFPTDPSGFITRIFAILLSVSGGIAALLIIKAGYQLMTSQGKPEQLQAGRDQLIAAIVGLVFLIFSFALLQIIGFNILHIPGFGGGAGGGGGAANNTGAAKGQSCNVFTTKCATGLTCKPNSTGGTLGTCQ